MEGDEAKSDPPATINRSATQNITAAYAAALKEDEATTTSREQQADATPAEQAAAPTAAAATAASAASAATATVAGVSSLTRRASQLGDWVRGLGKNASAAAHAGDWTPKVKKRAAHFACCRSTRRCDPTLCSDIQAMTDGWGGTVLVDPGCLRSISKLLQRAATETEDATQEAVDAVDEEGFPPEIEVTTIALERSTRKLEKLTAHSIALTEKKAEERRVKREERMEMEKRAREIPADLSELLSAVAPTSQPSGDASNNVSRAAGKWKRKGKGQKKG
jgi:hypothetical protein